MRNLALQTTDVTKWSALLCYDWAWELIRNNHFDSLKHSIDNFYSVTGKELLEYREEDFNSLVPGYGDFFYKEFQALFKQREIINKTTAFESAVNTVVLCEDDLDEQLFSEDLLTPLQPADTTTNHFQEHQLLNMDYEIKGESCFPLENASIDLCTFKTQYFESDTSLHSDEMASLQCKVDLYVPNFNIRPEDDKQQIENEPSSLLFTNSETYTPKYTDNEDRALKCHYGIFSNQFSPLEETKLVFSSQLMSSTKENINKENSITRKSLRSCNTQEKTKDQKTPQSKLQTSMEQHYGSPVLQKIPTKTRKRDRGPKNWEFLVRLLVNESTNPSLVKWEDRSTFTFRIVKSHCVATLWGSRSPTKKNLTYENFARGLRYHYKTKSLHEVSGKKLVYRCGEKAIKFLNELESSVSILRT